MSTEPLTLQNLVEQVEPEPDLKAYREREQVGDAELFASMFRGQVVYDHLAGKWFVWRGNHWEQDRSNELRKLVSNHLSSKYLQAGASAVEKGDKDEAKAFINRARALLRRSHLENVLYFCESQDTLTLIGEEWDRDPMVLGVNNGVIDLRTGICRAGQPNEYMQVYAPVDWFGLDQPAPHWEQFVHEIFAEDPDMVSFIQRLLGYCLTGSTIEHCLPILFGEGRNGKSTLLQALANVFGSQLSHTTQADALMNIKRDASGPQPFIHALRGKRLVWATESREGQQINAGLVKQLTGGDSITTRTLHEKPVTFKPTHKVMLLTNHKPHIDPDDQAMWDRVLPIPFDRRFVEEPKGINEYRRDPRILEKLEAESAGMLAWLVRGCLAWQQEGLHPPSKVKAATEAYREEEDTIGEFISDCLIIGEGKTATAREIYETYLKWAKENGFNDPLKKTALGKKLKRRFGEPKQGSRERTYFGVGILE